MPVVSLRAVSRRQGNNAALKSGEVPLQGFSLEFEEVPVLVHAFRRMVREVAYDVCEMAITTYLCAKEHGRPFTALPIFLARGLHHDAIVSNPECGARSVSDLRGTTVGVNRGYTVTTGVWARAILQDEYGVAPSDVTWAPSGDEHVEEYVAPSNVQPLDPGSDLVEMVVSGRLAAAVGITSEEHPDLQPLIPDPAGSAKASLISRGRYPINHLIVVRDEIIEQHPWLGSALFEAFAESKRRFVAGLSEQDPATLSPVDRAAWEVQSLTGRDPFPYGIGGNRSVLEDLIGHAVTQGILRTAPDLESLFVAGTSDLSA